MPSSKKVGQQGEMDVTTVVSTQAKATQALLQCGTEGLSPATLVSQTIYLKLRQEMLYITNCKYIMGTAFKNCNNEGKK